LRTYQVGRRIEAAAIIDISPDDRPGAERTSAWAITEAAPMRPTPNDPSTLSPHQRLRELTAILANGIHRLRARPPVPPENREFPAEFSQTGLEPAARTCPHGVVVTPRENGDR
jgi:hypothetical protein